MRKYKFSLMNLAFVLIFAIIIFEAIALLLGSWIEEASMIKPGPSMVLLSIAAGVMIPFVILKRQMDDRPFGRRDVFMILVAMGTILFLVLKLEVLVPDAFESAVYQIQSTLGLR